MIGQAHWLVWDETLVMTAETRTRHPQNVQPTHSGLLTSSHGQLQHLTVTSKQFMLCFYGTVDTRAHEEESQYWSSQITYFLSNPVLNATTKSVIRDRYWWQRLSYETATDNKCLQNTKHYDLQWLSETRTHSLYVVGFALKWRESVYLVLRLA